MDTGGAQGPTEPKSGTPHGSRGSLNWPTVAAAETHSSRLPFFRRALFPLTAVLVVACGAAALLGLSAAQSANAKVTELETEIAALSQQQARLAAQQDEAGATFGSLPNTVAAMDSRLAAVEDVARTAGIAASDAALQADRASMRADELASCINDYMKVVGDSRGGYYRYRFC